MPKHGPLQHTASPRTSGLGWLDEAEHARLVAELRRSRERIAAQLATAASEATLARTDYDDFIRCEPVPCFLLDANGVIRHANDCAASLLGADPRRLAHSPLLVFVAAKDRRAWLDHVRRCRRTNGIVVTELELRTRPGLDLPVELSSRALADSPDGGVTLLTVASDLRERRRLAHERTRTLERLHHAHRERELAQAASAEKDRFIAMLSHELRTPITPVLLAIGALKDDASLPAALRDTLAMVHRNVTIQVRLLDDLLDLNRLRQDKLVLEPATVDLHAVAREVVRFLQPEIDAAGLTVAMDLRATRPVKGDLVRLDQVVWNLVRNSLRFGDPGGRIDIATRDQGPGFVELVVTDSGAGFDPASRDRLFEPFTQVGDGAHRGGLGLGLAIVAGIVRAHGGRIDAWSDGPGKGARFTVTLPADEEPAAAIAPPMAPTGPSTHAPLTVLLVEDHPDTATALSLVLEQEGYSVYVAGSFAEAVASAATCRVDVLVSDLSLPDGSGLDLMRALSAERPMRGVALTGWGRESDVAATREAGFEHHLTKPVDVPTLVAAIESLRPARG